MKKEINKGDLFFSRVVQIVGSEGLVTKIIDIRKSEFTPDFYIHYITYNAKKQITYEGILDYNKFLETYVPIYELDNYINQIINHIKHKKESIKKIAKYE